MDDIASELGISKKTIYQHFADKDEIVYQVMLQEMHNDKCEHQALEQQSENVIDKIVKATNVMREQLGSVNPSLFFDLKKYYPRAWQIFQEYKQNFLLETIRQDFIQGIKEGVFRPEINVEILSHLRMEQIEFGFDMQALPTNKYTLFEIQYVFLDHFVRGILSEKGKVLYEAYLHKQLAK